MRVIWDIYTVLFAIFKKASNVDIKSGVTLKISHIETSNLVTYLLLYSWSTEDKSKLGLFGLDSFTLVLMMMDAKNSFDNLQMQHNVSNLLPSFLLTRKFLLP